MDADLDRRIRADNLRMHDAPGYADFYDAQLSLIRNPWEQRLFRDDLRRMMSCIPPRCSALDLGCGTGNLALKLLELGANVTGVDLSSCMLDRLRRKAGLHADRLTLHAADVDSFLRVCPDRFHLVTACSFLHHLPDYLATASAAAALVAPGGFLYLVHEPLPPGRADLAARALERLDFLWQRIEARTGLGGRVARHDPYYKIAGLADYWAMGVGLDESALLRALVAAGLRPRPTRYDSKRHRILHVLAKTLRTEHLLRITARRPD